MKLKNCKFLFLDVGDTLIHLKKSPGHIYTSILEKYGYLDKTDFQKDLKEIFRIVISEILSKPNPEWRDRYFSHPQGTDGWWKQVINLFVRKVKGIEKITVGNEAIQEIFAIFDDPKLWEIDSGYGELLGFCKANSIGMGIISNWDTRLRKLLTDLNLIQDFTIVLISSEFGYEKPSPKIFQMAESLCQFPPDSITFIGDKIELDYDPPRKLGWNSFLMTRSERIEGYDCIHSLSDLVK